MRKSDDEFGGFGGFDKPKTVSTASLFSDIIKDGAASGVFPLVWADGYQSALRWLGRELMNRFEHRILFAMNANDSSHLIDSPAAGRLGTNRALLFRADLGTLDKFRPYKAPLLGWLHELQYGQRNPVAPLLEETHEVSPDATSQTEQPNAVELSVVFAEASDMESASEATEKAEATNNDSIDDTWTDISELNVN